MLTVLVQWILHKTPNHLLQCPRSTTRPSYFWCFASNSAFFRWHMSINDAKWTVAPDVLASSITCFLLLTFVSCHARIFSSLHHYFSTAAFASCTLMLETSEWTCVPNCSDWVNLFLLQQCDLGDACAVRLPIEFSEFRQLRTLLVYLVLCFPLLRQVSLRLFIGVFQGFCCWHRNFQLSMSNFHGTFEFFVGFNDEDTT